MTTRRQNDLGVVNMQTCRIYSGKFLKGELFQATQKMSSEEFIEFHIDSLNKLSRNLFLDSLFVTRFSLDRNLLIDGNVVSFVARNNKNAIENYLRFQIYDDYSNVSFRKTGEAVFCESLFSADEWQSHPIFLNHCADLELKSLIGLTYNFPNQKNTYMAFDYTSGKYNRYLDVLTQEYVEYVSYPFYLSWLHIFGVICAETLSDWLSLCEGMSEARFKVLRALSKAELLNVATLAEALSMARGTVYRHLENSYENLLSRNSNYQELTGNANRILALSRAYRFFDYGTGCVTNANYQRNAGDV